MTKIPGSGVGSGSESGSVSQRYGSATVILTKKNPIFTYNFVLVEKIFETLSQVSEPWTPEGGLVTAAMKLKRKSIEHAFQVLLLCKISVLICFAGQLTWSNSMPFRFQLIKHAF